MNALVIGGSTFIGRRLAELLHRQGVRVAVLNRGRTGTELPDDVERLLADRTDHAAMRSVLEGRRWDAVFDVSAFVQIAGRGDMAGLVDLLDGACGRYVFVSSIMAYQQGRGVFPWREDDPPNPDPPSTYGGFKAMVERLVLERHADTGFPATVVRPAAVYGPYNNIFDMEAAMFLRLRHRRPVLVPHEGLVVGSYGHVDDLCDAMVAMATTEAAVGEIVNVTAEAVTVRHYVDTLAAVVGREPDVVLVPPDVAAGLAKPAWGHLFGANHHGALAIDKAQRILSWSPHHDLRSGHEQTYAWFVRSGLAERGEEMSLVDPLWRASYDFVYEQEVAAGLRG